MLRSLLAPGQLGTLTLRNRILMSPMGTNLAETDGTLGERLLTFYEARARGGAALLLAGSVGVSWPRGTTNPNQVALSSDAFIPGVRELARRVHRHGAKVALQLHHGGRNAVFDIAAGRPLFVPSIPWFRGANDKSADFTRAEADAVADMRAGAAPEFAAASRIEIDRLVEDFADAAERAQLAGIDGVEIHAAHGYAIAGFLSPAWNSRDDEYGGGSAGRARLLNDVLRAVRERVGKDYPVWCRLDACEFRVAGGLSIEDAKRNARFAEEAGADAIHVSAYSDGTSGIGFTEGPLVHAESGYSEFAAQVKKVVRVPVIAVGRIEPHQADQLIESGGADFVAMGRKLIADPELPNKLLEARGDDIRPCIYCYRCVGEVCVGRHVRCAVNPLAGRESESRAPSVSRPRHVVILGAGPGGMEAARVAASRGHRVTLVEQSDRVGGRVLESSFFYPANGRLVLWLAGQLKALGVDIRTGFRAHADNLSELEPDTLIVATGGRPGGSKMSVEVLSDATGKRHSIVDAAGAANSLGDDPTGRFVILGGDLIGLEIAEWLVTRGCETLVLEEGVDIGSRMAVPRRWRSLHILREHGANVVTEIDGCRWENGTVRYTTRAGRSVDAPAEFVIDARPPSANSTLARSLRPVCRDVREVGDAQGGSTIEEAILDGFEAGEAVP